MIHRKDQRTMINDIEKRLGLLVGVLRKRKLKAGNPSFKQSTFIQTDRFNIFEGLKDKTNVCSLATLSRLENGKHHHDFALLDFFLKKLDCPYRIKESVLNQENHYLNQITNGFAYSSFLKLITLIETCDAFYQINLTDALLNLDYRAFRFVNKIIHDQHVTRTEYERLTGMIEILHPNLIDWMIGCGMWLKQTHPDFWDLKVINKPSEFLDNCKLHFVLLSLGKESFPPLYQPYYQPFHQESWALKQIKWCIRTMHPEGDVFGQDVVGETALCILIAQEVSSLTQGTSQLYHALLKFNSLEDPFERLSFLSSKLLDLLKHEPSPKPITKILSQNIVSTCQMGKSYKPLMKLIKLLNENNSQIGVLSL